MRRNNYVLPLFQWRFDTDDRRILKKTVCEKINYLNKTSKESLDSLKLKVKTYCDLLANNRLRDENFARKLDYVFLRYLAIVVGFPVFLTGYLSNLIPFIVPKFVCDKLIKDLRFYSSVYVSSGTVFYLIYLPVLLVLAGLIFGWTGFLLGLLVPLLGYLVLFYQEIFWERVHFLHFKWKSIQNPKIIGSLVLLRKAIMADLDKITLLSDN